MFLSNPHPHLESSLCATLALLLFAFVPCRASTEEYRSPSDGIVSMRYEEGLLSLEAKDALLDKVLKELSRMAMIIIISDGPVQGRLTVHLDDLPLDKAVRKILRGKDTSLVYASKTEPPPTQYVLREVRIYTEGAKKGGARHYGYASKPRDQTPRRSTSRTGSSRTRRSEPPAKTDFSPPAALGSREDAQDILSDLMEGNFDGLNEIAERLREENPQIQEQIDEFLESLEEARLRAEESGESFLPSEGMGDVHMLMQQMLRGGGFPPRTEPAE